jgi:uncharacterized membrane protein
MKNITLILLGTLCLLSCSAPKYSYFFDSYNYNAGKKKKVAEQEIALSSRISSPLLVDENALTASTDNNLVLAQPETKTASPVIDAKQMEKYSSMSRSEKKAFRKELKNELKTVLKTKKKANGDSVKDTKVMDYNLKMTLIFLVVALILGLFGGVNSIFWILSVVSLVVAAVFFIKWIAEQ